jgi:chemotaxis protein MotB
MGRRKKEEDSSGSSFETVWADLNSFLMITFLILYTFVMDKVSEKEQKVIYESIRLSIRGEAGAPEKNNQEDQMDRDQKKESKIIEEVVNFIKEEHLTDYMKIMIEENKIRIVLDQPVLFDSGKSKLKETAFTILGDIGKILDMSNNPIVIEGHTDDIPIHNDEYDSNWDLSFDRAYSVVKILAKEAHLRPDRIHAIGFGEYRPIVPNDSEANRAKNRRIEINLLLKETIVHR